RPRSGRRGHCGSRLSGRQGIRRRVHDARRQHSRGRHRGGTRRSAGHQSRNHAFSRADRCELIRRQATRYDAPGTMADGSHAGYKIAWLNMSTVEEAEKLLSKMTPGEKAQLLQRVAQESKDAYPGIDTTVGVCGGEAVIVRTRIPVWVLEQARRLGSTEADLLRL